MALKLDPPTSGGVRETDSFGSGRFRAPRGNRLHKGLDFLAAAGDPVVSPTDGTVRRIGICYSDDPRYRLVEIDASDALVRVFYVDPTVAPGDEIAAGDLIGSAQDVAARYENGMKNHVHLEVRLRTALLGRGREPGESVWADPALFLS